MHNFNQPIDATKFDIRGLWSGLEEEHISSDVGKVEGYPFDPPDEGAGWQLVAIQVYEGKKATDPDRYFTLWKRPKVKVRKKRKARTPKDELPADIQALKDASNALLATPTPEKPAQPKRVRKPKKAKRRARKGATATANTEPAPAQAAPVEETPPPAN